MRFFLNKMTSDDIIFMKIYTLYQLYRDNSFCLLFFLISILWIFSQNYKKHAIYIYIIIFFSDDTSV
jgi:hypothetical protein